MSMTPVTPNLTLKSFWAKPEGKAGIIFLAGAVGLVLFNIAAIVTWLTVLITNMLYLGFLIAVVVGIVFVLFDKTFRNLAKNVFQSAMRCITSFFVEIDPIGILKNNLDSMKKQEVELSKGLEGCSGAKVRLERTIANNDASVSHSKSLIEQTEKVAAQETNPYKKQSLNLKKSTYLQEIGRRMHSTENLKKILKTTTGMYGLLIRWQQLAEFNIDNTDATIKNAQEERNAILESYKALGPAQRLIKGDPEELKLANAALEFLAEDNAKKLGAMEDFARYSEKSLSNMDLEQGANASDAEKMLSEYETKLLEAGGAKTVPNSVVRTADAALVPRSSNAIEGDYLDSFK